MRFRSDLSAPGEAQGKTQISSKESVAALTVGGVVDVCLPAIKVPHLWQALNLTRRTNASCVKYRLE